MELRHGPNSYGRQQWGILHNGRKPDAATPRERRRSSDRKALSLGKIMTVPLEEAPANYVPAAAVIRRGQAKAERPELKPRSIQRTKVSCEELLGSEKRGSASADTEETAWAA